MPHFEAKKHAYRQTQDGIVVSFVVHPNDVSSDLALAPLGTRYMVAFEEFSETNGSCSSTVEPGGKSAEDAGSTPAGSPTSQVSDANGSPKKSWSEYSRSQQAAILCADKDFMDYFIGPIGGEDDCAESIREHFRIVSRSELNKPENHARWDEFVAIYHLHRDRLR